MPPETDLTMNATILNAAKTELRSMMKQRLAGLSQDSIAQQSKTVFNTLKKFRPYADAKRIAVYLAMPGGEIQTDQIVRHAIESGKQVFVPYLHKSGLPKGEGPPRLMDMVSLKSVKDYESLQPDKWGIPSIDDATVHERHRSVGEIDGTVVVDDVPLDLILLPGVAFDMDPVTGVVRRLGHGKGFYDYFLHRYTLKDAERGRMTASGRTSVLLYALGLKEQFLGPGTSTEKTAEVPVEPHDQPLDGLLLGDGQVKLSTDARGLGPWSD